MGYQQKINVDVNEHLNLLFMIPICTLNLNSWMFASGQFATVYDWIPVVDSRGWDPPIISMQNFKLSLNHVFHFL